MQKKKKFDCTLLCLQSWVSRPPTCSPISLLWLTCKKLKLQWQNYSNLRLGNRVNVGESFFFILNHIGGGGGGAVSNSLGSVHQKVLII